MSSPGERTTPEIADVKRRLTDIGFSDNLINRMDSYDTLRGLKDLLDLFAATPWLEGCLINDVKTAFVNKLMKGSLSRANLYEQQTESQRAGHCLASNLPIQVLETLDIVSEKSVLTFETPRGNMSNGDWNTTCKVFSLAAARSNNTYTMVIEADVVKLTAA